MLNIKVYCRSVFSSFLIVWSLLYFIPTTSLLAWDKGLIKAAEAVRKGTNSEYQLGMVLSRNYEINLLAMKGKINNTTFQKCQHIFVVLSTEIGKRQANRIGVDFNVQVSKSPSYKPGTDSDYITGATEPDQVIKMQEGYNKDFTVEMIKLGINVSDNTNWVETNDIDLMADASKTTRENFNKIAELNNAAYKRPGSARYEAYSRSGEDRGPPNIQDSIDYIDEMQDMIHHRDELLQGLRKEFDSVMYKLSQMNKNDSGYSALRNEAEALDTEIFKQQALQAKYMDRINVTNDNLKLLLPPDSPLRHDNALKLPVDYTDKDEIKKASKRNIQDNPFDARALGAMKKEILDQQMQKHIEIMAAVVEHNPESKTVILDTIKRYASKLDQRQKKEILQTIKEKLSLSDTDKIFKEFKKNIDSDRSTIIDDSDSDGRKPLTAGDKKAAMLLKKVSDNPKAVKLWTGIIYQRALTAYNNPQEAIDGFNGLLDVLDNHTVEKLRANMTGVKFNVNGKIVSVSIGSINQYLNGTMLETIGNNAAYKNINLALEGKAYYDAVMNANTWSQGFENLGYELMSRRLPGNAAAGAWANGNYTRLAIELTYLAFPLLAVPEGLYGMAKSTAEWGVEKLNEWEYNTLVDTLYDSAKFQKKDSKWYMTELSYPCPNPKKIIQLTIKNQQIEQKDDLYKLLISCPHISSILYPKVHDHPALKQFEEMLDSPRVSTGKAEILGFGAGWPYLYVGLSKYGKKLYKLYLKKVDEVTLEYFKGVIDGLEKRKAWQTGTGYAKIIKLEKKLGCKKPLIEYTKGVSLTGHIMGGDDLKEDIKKDAERFQEVIDTYAKLKESNKKIMELKKKWKAEFLRKKKPYCSIKSIKETEKNTAKLVSSLIEVVKESRAYVEKHVNAKPTFKDLQPMTRARLCMIYFKRQKTEFEKINYAKCYWENIELKKKYKDESGIFEAKIKIVPNETKFCIDEKVTLSVEYNMRRDNSEVSWEILNEQGKVEQILKLGIKTVWKPKSEGIKLIRAQVKASYMPEGGVLKSKRKLEKRIRIKPESECSRLEITLDADNIVEIAKDSQTTITAKISSLAPGNPPVTRYFWFEDGKKMPSSKTPTYLLLGKEKGNRIATIEVIARDENRNLSEKASIKIHIKDKATNSLDMKIISPERKVISKESIVIKDNETILLKAIVNPKPNSGKLIFRWSANKKTVLGGDGNAVHFKGKGWTGKKVTIDVIVMDEKDREGTASLTFDVKSSKDTDVELEEHKTIVTERDVLRLQIKRPKKNVKKYKYLLKRNNRIEGRKTEWDYFTITDFHGHAGESIKFTIEVYDVENGSLIGETSTVIKVISSKKEDEKDVKEKPTTLKITAPAANQETPETTILVAGEVSAFENVVSMQMIVNGVTYQMKPSAKFNQKMPIVPGKNTLQVSAKLKDGHVIHSQTVTVKSTQSAENRYRFTLRWNTARTDIDLWLESPTGESCSYNNKNSSFAELDRDEKEAGYGPENIFIAQLTDYGKYKVRVQYYADHNKEDSEEEIPTTPTEAEVLFFIDNKLSKRWKGSLTSEDQWWDVYSFTYGMDIEINSPAKTSVKIGETLNLTAKVKETSEGLGEMLKGKHVFRWVGDNGVEFSPVDTLKPKTTALFTRPGKVKIRVQVMIKQGDELKKVGESKEITIDVVGVTYKLKVDPPKPMVGQEAVITVVPDYSVDKKTLDFRWEVSGSVLRQGLMEAGNAWKYGVTSKASKPITVIARGRTPFHGDDVGEASLTFTPQLYIVKAVKQGNAYGGMSVRVYDPRLRDFVEAPQGTVITDQTMRLHATIEGEPLPSDVRWKWTVNEGTSLGNDISQEPTVMRHESGTIVAKVEARNKEDVILGSAEISFSVFESDHGPKASQIKLKDAQDAWKNGDIYRAIILIDEARKMNPKDTVIQHESERMHKDSIRIKSLLKDAKAMKVSGKLKEAKINVDNALKLNKKYNPAIRLRDEIDQLIKQQKERELAEKKKIAQLLKDAKVLKEAGKLDEAVAVLRKGSKQFPANKEIVKLLKEVQKQQSDALKKMKEGQAEWKSGMLGKAVSTLKKAVKIDPSNRQIVKVLKAMQDQKKMMDDALKKADQLIGEKKLEEATRVLNKAARISSKYPDYVKMLKKLDIAKREVELQKQLLKDAKALKNAGKLDEAVTVLKKGSKQFPGTKKIDKLLKEVQKQQEDARKKMAEGQAKWKNGVLGKAVSTVEDAIKIDPSNKQIAKVLKAMQGQKKMMDDALKKADKLIEQKKFDQAKGVLKKAERISSKYPPYVEIVKKLESTKGEAEQELLKKAKDLWSAGRLGDAIDVLKKGSKQFASNKKIKQALQKMQKDKKRADNKISKAEDFIEQKKFTEAESSLRQAGAISKKYPPYTEMLKKLDSAKQQASEEETPSSVKPPQKPKTEKADNIGGVANGPKKPTTFRFDTSVKLLFLQTYHWNNGIGMTSPGKIGLRHSDGTMYGPWQTHGRAGQGGVPNAYWEVNPNVPLKPGIYTVVDSDPKTWSTNAQEDWKGFAIIRTGPLNYPDEKPKGSVKGVQILPKGTGSKQTISAKYGPPPSANSWTHYNIPLTAENFGVDKQTFEQVMANVSSFRIATEMHNGKDFGSIDTVHIGNRYASNFNSSTDGWNAAGDGTMQWLSSGGASGGYLQISDWASGELHWAVAPVSWSGNWQELIGRSIDFYYKTDHPSYGATIEISSEQKNRLGLTASPMTIKSDSSTSLTVSTYPVSQKDLTLSLKSSNTQCVTVERSINISAGTTKADTRVYAASGAKDCNAVVTVSSKGYGETRITLTVEHKNLQNSPDTDVKAVEGKTISSTNYTPNSKGDVFEGGHWAGSSGGSDWLQKDFSSPQPVRGIYIGRASTDITTKGFRLILKLKKPNGDWIIIDELHDTNINRTALSGGAIGKSIPSYSKKLSSAIKATAFRLEFYGNGWFDATDIRIYTSKISTSPILDTEGIDGIVSIDQTITKENEVENSVEAEKFKEDLAQLEQAKRELRELEELIKMIDIEEKREEPEVVVKNSNDSERSRKQCTSFIKIKNAGIPGYNKEIINNISLSDCKKVCTERSWCKSVDYNREKKHCYVQNVNQSDVPLKRDYPGNPYDHYVCNLQPSDESDNVAKEETRPIIKVRQADIVGAKALADTKPGASLIPAPESTLPVANQAGGYWKLVNIKGSTGRECTSKDRYVYSNHKQYLIAGKEGEITIKHILRKKGQVVFVSKAIWQRPPEKMYPDSTLEFPLSIKKLQEDTSVYWGAMSIGVDTHDMECGATGGGGIGGFRIDHKSPNSVSKTPQWKVKESHGKVGEKLTIRVCYSGGFICGKRGWKYYYEWILESSKVDTLSAPLNTENIDEKKAKAAQQAELAKKIQDIRDAAEKANKLQEEKDRKAKLAEKIKKIREAAKTKQYADEVEKAERRAENLKKKSTKKFMGTLSGTWSGPWSSKGSFVMNISETGKISGRYWGDDKGKLSGSVSGSGELNMKSGGGSAGSGTWGGAMKIDSYGKLKGSGTWNVDGYKGTWHGTGK